MPLAAMIAGGGEKPWGFPPGLAADVPERRRITGLAALLLWAPMLVYLASLWLLVPVPFPYFTPLLFLATPFLVKISRSHVFESISRFGPEFALLGLMILLSFLSLANSNAPFRSFRVIYPCLVPFLLFLHFMAMASVSRRWLLGAVRVLLLACFVFSVLPLFASFILPPLRSILFEQYRLRGFFEISIQHAIALGSLFPVAVVECVLQRKPRHRLVAVLLLLALAYTMFRAGSKTAMSMGFAMGLITYVGLKLRSQSWGRSFVMFFGIGTVGLFLWFFGLDLAEKLEPETGAKLRSIVEGGVTSYQSVQIRRHLWEVAMEEGKAHWLVGSGAGEIILNYPHAHNLVLDYFKNIGLFGAAAVLLLSLTILLRTARIGVTLLRTGGSDDEKRIFACHMGAVSYVLSNQMSDCFGPSTIGFLWVIYLAARLAVPSGARIAAVRNQRLLTPAWQDHSQFPSRLA